MGLFKNLFGLPKKTEELEVDGCDSTRLCEAKCGTESTLQASTVVKEPRVSKVSGCEPETFTTIAPGKLFEEQVFEYLQELVGKSHGEVFQNIVLPQSSSVIGTIEIDVVAVMPCCILVVECKDWAGVIHARVYDDSEWLQVLPNDTRRMYYNPVRQNAFHIQILAQYLGIPADLMASVIVFSSRGELQHLPHSTSNLYVGRARGMHQFLGQLLENSVKPVPYLELTKAKLRILQRTSEYSSKNHEDRMKLHQAASKCPRCGQALCVRTRRADGHTFLGCTGFPECRYTRDL